MNFNVGTDSRGPVSDVQNFNYNDTRGNHIQGRQNEGGLRRVLVNVKQGDVPLNLTNTNIVFEGLMADGEHRIIDSSHGTIINAAAGQFSFTFPYAAFAYFGTYKQALFVIKREAGAIATLEFSFDVLVNLVEPSTMPENYITPFDKILKDLGDLYDNSDKDFQKKLADWGDQVNNTIFNLNGQYGNIQETANLVQSKLDNIAQKAAAGDLATHGEMEAFKNDVNADVQKSLTVAPEATEVFGGYVKDKDVAALNNLKNSIDKTKFNLVFMTDNHYSSLTSDPNKPTNYTLQHVANASYFDNVDAIILGGDNVDGDVRSLANLTSDTRQITYKLLLGSMNNVDKFFLLGNHDDGSLRVVDWVTQGRSYDKPIPFTEAQMKGFYHTADLLNDEHRVNDSLYFYKDYPDKKVRLIGLNSDDMPEDILNPDGSQKYDRLHHMGWRQEQLNWLANTALSNFPKGYTALIVQHTPLDGDGGSQFYNTDAIQQILGAFKAGASTTITGNTPDFGINISTTFAEQGPQKLAGCIHGHLHKEDYKQVAGVNDIGVTSSVVNPITDDITEDEDTDAFDVVTVDTETSTVSLQGFGRATDRKFDY